MKSKTNGAEKMIEMVPPKVIPKKVAINKRSITIEMYFQSSRTCNKHPDSWRMRLQYLLRYRMELANIIIATLSLVFRKGHSTELANVRELN